MSSPSERVALGRREELLGDRREIDEPPPRRLPMVAATAAVMVLFAAGLWFAYWAGTRHAGGGAAAIPLIHADARPIMVKPVTPGGLQIPDRNMLIYNPDQRLAEHLLPPPEEPMARSGAAAPAAAAVKQPDAPAATATPTAPASTPAAPAPAVRGAGFRLQLGSVKTADAARLEWDRIRARNRDLFAGLSASPVRADLGAKGVYWRIETGPVGEVAAGRICSALKQRKFGCIVVR